MSERRPAQTIGELDIHLANMQATFAEFARKADIMAQNMATKADMERVQTTIAGLATKAEVDARYRAFDEKLITLDKRIADSTPSSLMGAVATFSTRLLVIIAVCGLLVAGVRWIDHIPPAVIAVK